MEAQITTRLTLKAPKASLYHFFADTARLMADRPLEDPDTYHLEITLERDIIKLIVREAATTTVVNMRVFAKSE